MKLRGFTLLEVTLAMILSGLVLLIAGAAYLLIGQNFSLFQSSAKDTHAMYELRGLLVSDFEQSSTITKTGDGLLLELPASGGMIEYRFLSNSTERIKDGIVHKLSPRLLRLKLKDVKGEPAHSGDLVAHLSLEVTVNNLEGNYSLEWTKQYGSKEQLLYSVKKGGWPD